MRAAPAFPRKVGCLLCYDISEGCAPLKMGEVRMISAAAALDRTNRGHADHLDSGVRSRPHSGLYCARSLTAAFDPKATLKLLECKPMQSRRESLKPSIRGTAFVHAPTECHDGNDKNGREPQRKYDPDLDTEHRTCQHDEHTNGGRAFTPNPQNTNLCGKITRHYLPGLSKQAVNPGLHDKMDERQNAADNNK